MAIGYEGYKGYGSPEQIAKTRALIDALMTKNRPMTTGDGLVALGDGIVANVLNRRAEESEKAGMADWENTWSSLMSGGDLLGSAATSGVAGELAATSPAVAGGEPMTSSTNPDVAELEGYIRNAATQRGIDPDVAVRVARSEGLAPGVWQSNVVKNGKRETSYGPFQLLVGGGLGDKFQKIYGKSPADPSTVQQQIDFALDEAAQGGWGPWYGAAKVGVGRRTGLENARALGYQPPAEVASLDPSVGMVTPEAAIEAVAPGSGSVVPQEPQFDAGRFGDPINLAEMPPNAAQLPGSLVEQGANYAPPLPPPTNVESRPVASVAESLVQPPVEVAQAGGAGYFPPAPQPPQQGRPSVAQLLAAANHPFAPKAAQSVIGTLLEQEMKRNDPMTQLQLQKAQLEFEALRNPQPKDTDDIREYNFAVSQGFDGSFNDFQLHNRRAGATNVTTNVGEGDKFYENLDKKNAETFATMSDAGIQARGKLAQIDRLDALLSQSPQGAEAGVKQWLGDMGIPSEGLDAIQATRALLEKMVPEQRPPGSGPMSDADIAMFRNSLPRVIGQPGGNQLILQSMRGVAEYEMQMGQIADMVADRAITPAEGRERIRNLKNPLEEYNKMVRDMGKTQKGGRIGEIEWSVD